MNTSDKSEIIRLPGLIDIHVHLREPGQTEKENFETGTRAAIAGGFTMILDMPNNLDPIISRRALMDKMARAKHRISSDLGFHFGSLGDNTDEFKKIYQTVTGLKLYLNQTTGGFIIDVPNMKAIYRAWHRLTKTKPILLHAEDDVMPAVTKVLTEIPHPTHICHVSSEKELTAIMKAKKRGLPITCGVCPHHLFLTKHDLKKLGSFGLMKPSLKTKKDQKFLWDHLDAIDVIESDHAPHTKKEKQSMHPPFGVPGLETTLPLLLTAMDQKRISLEQIIQKCSINPRAIFRLPEQRNTYIEVARKPYTVRGSRLYTKCRWSPFEGWRLQYQVERVILRDLVVFSRGRLHPLKRGSLFSLRPS